MNFNGVQGLTMASGRLTYSRTGVLRAVDFRNGRPAPGTDGVVGNATGDWSSLGLFVLPGNSTPPPPGQQGSGAARSPRATGWPAPTGPSSLSAAPGRPARWPTPRSTARS